MVGTGAAWPPSLWVFLILPLWPFKGNIPSAGAVDAGGGCSGPGRVVSWGRATSCCRAEDSEAFPQPLRVHAALAWRPCVRGELPGARQPVEPALPRRGSSAARSGALRPNRSCLSLVCGTSSPIWGFELRAGQAAASHYLLVPFQQPVATAECAHPTPNRQKRHCGNGSHFQTSGQIGFVRFLEKNIS